MKIQNNMQYTSFGELIKTPEARVAIKRCRSIQTLNKLIQADKDMAGTEYFDIVLGKDLKCKIVSMAEINSNKFCVYSKNNCITIFNSHNFEEIDKIDQLKFEFRKIEVLNNDIIACFGKEIMLVSITQKNPINCRLSDYTDMCCEPNKVLLAKKNKIFQFSLELTKKDINLSKFREMDVSVENSSKINSLYLFKNDDNKKEMIKGKLIVVYNDTRFKMYLNNPNIFEVL
jgi:hypothetical protein